MKEYALCNFCSVLLFPFLLFFFLLVFFPLFKLLADPFVNKCHRITDNIGVVVKSPRNNQFVGSCQPGDLPEINFYVFFTGIDEISSCLSSQLLSLVHLCAGSNRPRVGSRNKLSGDSNLEFGNERERVLPLVYSSLPNKRICTPYLILTKLPPCMLLFVTASLSIFLIF